MITEIEVESSEKGAIAIPAKLLLDTLRGLPEQPITLQVNSETFGTEIISDNGRYKLSGENPIDFPKTPVVNRGQSVDLSSSALGAAIANTLFATSTDDLRPAMTGVFVQMGTENATFVATDGHRLGTLSPYRYQIRCGYFNDHSAESIEFVKIMSSF